MDSSDTVLISNSWKRIVTSRRRTRRRRRRRRAMTSSLTSSRAPTRRWRYRPRRCGVCTSWRCWRWAGWGRCCSSALSSACTTRGATASGRRWTTTACWSWMRRRRRRRRPTQRRRTRRASGWPAAASCTAGETAWRAASSGPYSWTCSRSARDGAARPTPPTASRRRWRREEASAGRATSLAWLCRRSRRPTAMTRWRRETWVTKTNAVSAPTVSCEPICDGVCGAVATLRPALCYREFVSNCEFWGEPSLCANSRTDWIEIVPFGEDGFGRNCLLRTVW